MMGKHVGRIALAPLVVVALTLTACQGIPSSGGVHPGLTGFAQSEQEIEYRPDSPMPDADQEEIVRGFIEAGSSPTNSYEIAREFLTREYRSQWDPYASVTIDEGLRDYAPGPDNTATMLIGGVASIDERGYLTQIDTDETTQFQFELVQEDGQWRISSAPNGVILDRSTFSDVWSSHQLYFTGMHGTLVPDTRWFLNRATVGTQIVNQLLMGPTEQLTGVAYSAFPTGTRLSSETVLIETGTAHIDLSPEFEAISEEAAELVALQLATSLYSVSGVSSYAVSVGGVELFSGPVGVPQSLAPETVETIGAAGMLTEEGFGFLTTTGWTDDPGFTRVFEGLEPTSIVMTRDGGAALALTDDGILWVSPENSFVLDPREGLIEPTVDTHGYVWTLHPDEPETITLWNRELDTVAIEVPELAGETVVAMRLSPDGTRMAFLVADDRATKVMITGVVRDDNGTPLRFVDLESPSMSWILGAPLDLDWIDAQRVAVLTKGDADSTRYTITGPGLFAESRAGVQGAVALRSGGRSQLTYLLTANGDVSSPQGISGWQRQAQDVTVLTKRG